MLDTVERGHAVLSLPSVHLSVTLVYLHHTVLIFLIRLYPQCCTVLPGLIGRQWFIRLMAAFYLNIKSLNFWTLFMFLSWLGDIAGKLLRCHRSVVRLSVCLSRSCIVLKRQKILTISFAYDSTIHSIKIWLTLVSPFLLILCPKVTHSPVDLSVGDIQWQIAAEWLQIAQWSFIMENLAIGNHNHSFE